MSDDVRKKLRAKRKALPVEIVSGASAIIIQKIIGLPIFSYAKNIAAYCAHENEIDPSEIFHYQKNIFLPVMKNQDEFEFYFTEDNALLEKNMLQIAEPNIDHKKPIAPEKLDLILIPIVAFDDHCNRLGRGVGCYDRYLQFTKKLSPDARAVLIGLAYEFQRVEKIMANAWDVKMDMIVTEEKIYSLLHQIPNHRHQN